MKTTIKIAYSENSKTVLAETKLEVEFDRTPTELELSEIQIGSKKIFEDAQDYALKKTMRRV